jgi:type II secretion system protein G
MRSRTTVAGFTLLEMLVVISIIAMLAAVILAALSIARKKARDAITMSNVRQIDQAIQQFAWDTGNYPPENTSNPGNENQCSGTFLTNLVTKGYVSSVPIDAYNCPYAGGFAPFVQYLNNSGNIGGPALDPVTQQNFMNLDCPNPANAKAVLLFYLSAGPTSLFSRSATNPNVNVICYY